MSEALPTPEPFDPLAAARGWLELWRMVWLDGPLAWAEGVDRTSAGPAGGPIDPLQALALGLGCDGLGLDGLGCDGLGCDGLDEPEVCEPPSPVA